MRLSTVALGVMLAVMGAACSSPCWRVKEARQELLAGAKKTAKGPHVEAVVPFALLDKEMSTAFRGQGDIAITLPFSGPLKKLVPAMTLRPHSVKLRAAKATRIGVRIRADVLLRKEFLFSLTLDTDARLKVDQQSSSAVLSVSGKDLQSVRPHVPKGAGARVVKSIWPAVPKLLRGTLSKKSLAAQLQKALVKLLEKDFSLTAAPLLKDVGEVVRTELSMGSLPIAAMRVRTDGKRRQLVLELDLSLPVNAGLPHGIEDPELKNEVLIRAGGAALAALANRAIEAGELPARYDEKGRPSPDGPYRAGLSWAKGKRPLRIHLFREEGQCIAVVLAGRPTLRLRQGRLTVGVEDATVAETTGEVLVQTAIWFRSLWSKAISFSRSSASATEFTVAGKKRKFIIKKAGYDAAGAFAFRVGLD